MKASNLSILHRLFIIVIIASLCFYGLDAQIKINERVTISPSPVPLFKAASGGDFVIEFQSSGTLEPTSGCGIYVNEGTSCYNLNEGNPQATVPLITGNYRTAIVLHATTIGTASYRYMANGQVLKGDTITVDQVPCDIFRYDSFGFFESFEFDHDSVVNDYWENVIVYGRGAICQAVQWSPPGISRLGRSFKDRSGDNSMIKMAILLEQHTLHELPI